MRLVSFLQSGARVLGLAEGSARDVCGLRAGASTLLRDRFRSTHARHLHSVATCPLLGVLKRQFPSQLQILRRARAPRNVCLCEARLRRGFTHRFKRSRRLLLRLLGPQICLLRCADGRSVASRTRARSAASNSLAAKSRAAKSLATIASRVYAVSK